MAIMRIGALFVCIATALGVALNAQAPSFDAASIKPNTSGDGTMTLSAGQGGLLRLTNMTLRSMIAAAYRTPVATMRLAQIIGGADWLDRDHFDVVARGRAADNSGGAAGLSGEIQEMLKTLLADRFHLVMHPETQQQPVFDLVMARKDGRLGARMHPTHVDCDRLRAANQEAFRAGRGAPPGSRLPCNVITTATTLSGGDITMEQLAARLAGPVGRPVRDRTGLAGTYNVELSWAPAPVAGATADAPPASQEASLFAALQEQLGLQLESTTGPIDVLVIDHAELPTPD